MKRTVFAYPYVVWMAIFIFAPMLLIVYYAFTMDGGFTLANLAGAADPLYLEVLLRSIWMAVRATAICLLLGYPIAYLLSRMKKSKATILSVLFVVPMWMNFLLRTYAWQVLLNSGGILNSLLAALGLPQHEFLYTEGAVMLGMVYNFLPFMVLPLAATLMRLDFTLLEAAEDLGARPAQAFWRITVPLSMPGIIAGCLLVFIPAVGEFVIPDLLGGPDALTIGRVLWTEFFTNRDWPLASAVAVAMLALIVIPTLVFEYIENRREEREAEA